VLLTAKVAGEAGDRVVQRLTTRTGTTPAPLDAWPVGGSVVGTTRVAGAGGRCPDIRARPRARDTTGHLAGSWPVLVALWLAILGGVKPSLLAEIRDWIAFALTGIFGYLTWRWRPRRDHRDVTIEVPPATARAVMPTPAILNLSPARGTSSASLALTTGDAGTQAVLGSMAEDFPYEFPPN
jgi:hypothetical protein